MNLLVIGGGGREHAIVKKLKENPAVETIYCAPGNGGIAADAVCVPEIGAKDISAQVEFAKAHQIGFAVVAPDDPLVLGAVDALEDAGIPCFGPEAKAAVIEGSKVFSKNLMKKYGIPTAQYEVFEDAAAAQLQRQEFARVLNDFLRQLTCQSRSYFIRRYWYGESIREIADSCGAGEEKIKSSLFRTRQRLRAVLEKEGML